MTEALSKAGREGDQTMDAYLLAIAPHMGRPVEVACNLVESILGPPAKRLGDLLGDQVSYWQWSNRLRIMEKVQQRIRDRGVAVRTLPLDFAVPWLRECGDAADPALQEWWAELLSSALADDANCHPAFVKVMGWVSAAEVRFLDGLLECQHTEHKGRIEAVAEATGMSPQQATVAFHTLESLGFFTPTGRRLKGFAFDFLRACCPRRDRIASYRERQLTMGGVVVMN